MPLTKSEKQILQSIVVASENDPRRPEFPPSAPKFPATPTHKISVPGFTNVWLKDESYNPTGTHKDRMAWEIIVTYRDFLLAKQRGLRNGKLPQMSILSSGSAAIAIQTALQKYHLPALKVLVDNQIHQKYLVALKQLGCEVYQQDLSKNALGWQDILRITKNPSGFDITSCEALDPTTRFYDWLGYEIINQSPEFCFVPFGTGNLYGNLLNINRLEVSRSHHDPRFRGKIRTLRGCHFLGATTNNKTSVADKLYSSHLPFAHFDEQGIRFYRYAGFCGNKTNVHLINETYIKNALALAQKQGISCEPSGIAGLALLLELRRQIPKQAKILIVNTGKVKLPGFK